MDLENPETHNRHIKVAIVDDDDSVCRALCRLLGQFNIDSERFSDGPEFMESLKRSMPDWVMLDFWMPRMTGWEILSKLEEMQAAIGTIIMSGDEEIAAPSIQCYGRALFLPKPIDQRTLLAAVTKKSRGLHLAGRLPSSSSGPIGRALF